MWRLLGWLRNQRSGNAAMMFGLAAMPIVLLVGLSVDFTMKTSARDALQEALDSALLAAARANADTEAERDAIAAQFAQTNFAERYGGHALTISITPGQEPGALLGHSTITMPTFLGNLFGSPQSVLSVNSTVNTNSPPLEVMLVLDKTGSMAGPKIVALRAAANDLVEEIMDGTRVRVGITPFARYVNIGMALRNEPGFDIPADGQTCAMETVWHGSNPRNCHTETATCYSDGAPYACSWQQCDQDWTSTEENVCHAHVWNGCVGSREEPLNAQDDTFATPVPGVMDVDCGANPITRLTADKNTVKNAIAALSETGNTYIPAGLMVGWHALSSRPILPDGTDPNSPDGRTMQRAVVLMTDGANTASKTVGAANHEDGDVNKANNLTRDLCRNIKDDQVRVFTVAFDVTDNSVLTMLRQCATNPADAFDAANAADLQAAFHAIGLQLSRLRISR